MTERANLRTRTNYSCVLTADKAKTPKRTTCTSAVYYETRHIKLHTPRVILLQYRNIIGGIIKHLSVGVDQTQPPSLRTRKLALTILYVAIT